MSYLPKLLTLILIGLAALLVGASAQAESPSPYADLLLSPAVSPYPSTQTPETLPADLSGPAMLPPIASEPLLLLPEESLGDNDSELAIGVGPVAEAPKWYHVTYWLQPSGWDSGVELGLNGSSGTSETLSFRTGAFVKRESDARKVDFDIYHNRTQAEGIETQNNAQVNFRHEWLFAESPWTTYLQSQMYYDAFQSFDYNINVNTGIGYRFIDNDWTDLTGRVGAGTSREFGGLDDQWVPEAQFGLDWEQKFSETQKFYANVDYFPEWENFSQFRLLTDVGWEVELVVPSNVSLKIAATDRYDSDPGGVAPHNLNYSVLLIWKR